ncbi:methyltransferase family protein [Coleofasciculus sp. F4-SAH-05]|uniref:methyltransferase family protein n=1 Tax=Coleofasciculus TaxID=669368 RepID=UPI0032F8A5A1
MKIKHFIDLHKGLTFPVILALMVAYQNFTIGSWVYLALHSMYGYMWILKSRIYPDKQWEQDISLGRGLFLFGVLLLYWVAPFILISSGSEPTPPLIAAAIAINLMGVFLHYSSDAQKYYTLKYHSGLITEGFFARCRNTNYLGEILIYGAFALLTQHWLPFLILAGFIAGIFIPNMLKKDQSLSRYPEFADYKARSGLLFPKLFVPKYSETNNSDIAQNVS